MALREILQNIHSFIDILQQSKGRAVETWRADDVRNALSWANYCEKIHAKSVGKPYQRDLDRHICEMGRRQLWLVGDTSICLALLQNATTTITESLLQNPWLSDSVFQTLLDSTDSETLFKAMTGTSRTALTIDLVSVEQRVDVPDLETDMLQTFLDANPTHAHKPVLRDVQAFIDTLDDM